MRYSQIRSMDVADGPGIRVSLFVQGCHFHCPGCFNESTWDFNGGKDFTQKEFDRLMELCGKSHVAGLSVLGGEPLTPENIDTVIAVCKKFKELYPNKNIWLWSGYLFENVINKDIFKYIDVMVDGQFKLELKNLSLKYCGSENQRVINVPESLKSNTVVLL